MTDKEQIMIDGVDVSGCKHYKINGKCRIPHYQQGIKYVNCNCNEWDCYFKQFQKEKFENLNNRQMVERAENLIYENSELIKNLKEKEQECEQKQKIIEELKKQLETSEKWRIKAESLNEKLNLENTCYRKALEEIEEIVNETCIDSQSDCKSCNFSCEHKDILDIINKAKGEE